MLNVRMALSVGVGETFPFLPFLSLIMFLHQCLRRKLLGEDDRLRKPTGLGPAT